MDYLVKMDQMSVLFILKMEKNKMEYIKDQNLNSLIQKHMIKMEIN